MPQAASTFGWVEDSTHPRRLALCIELRDAPTEGGRSSARHASIIAPPTCPTGRLARLAPGLLGLELGLELGFGFGFGLGLGFELGQVRVGARARARLGLGLGLRLRLGYGLGLG